MFVYIDSISLHTNKSTMSDTNEFHFTSQMADWQLKESGVLNEIDRALWNPGPKGPFRKNGLTFGCEFYHENYYV